MTADNWSHEETGDPLYADRRTELLILAQQRGNFAMFAAILRASSLVSSPAAVLRPGSASK
jgi:hypothetical protein